MCGNTGNRILRSEKYRVLVHMQIMGSRKQPSIDTQVGVPPTDTFVPYGAYAKISHVINQFDKSIQKRLISNWIMYIIILCSTYRSLSLSLYVCLSLVLCISPLFATGESAHAHTLRQRVAANHPFETTLQHGATSSSCRLSRSVPPRAC